MYDRFKKRALSWSQLQSFQYNPDEWFSIYILNNRQPPNSLMLAGSRIGDAIGTEDSPIDNTLVPGIKEYTVKAEIDGIKMVGHIDNYCPDTLTLNENKCSDTKGRWTQGKVDKHGQITMYVMLLQAQDGVRPEDVTCWLNFLKLEQVGVQFDVGDPPVLKRFKTNRTQEQVDQFLEDTKRTVELMHQYIERQPLSTPRPKAPAW